MARVGVLVLACCLLPAAAAADEWNKQYAVSGSPELAVETGDGSVELRAGTAGTIQARVVTQGYTIGDDGIRIIDRQTGNRVHIELRFPQTSSWFRSAHRSVRLELDVPPELRAEVRTGDGSITARGVGGDLRLTTGDGSIVLANAAGALQAHTGDGTIRAAGRFERVVLRTGDGSIELEATEGSRLVEPWRVNTGDGSVTVRVPENLAFDVDLKTGDGSMSVDPPPANGRKTEHQYRGQAGGGFPISVETGDGSIRLIRR